MLKQYLFLTLFIVSGFPALLRANLNFCKDGQAMVVFRNDGTIWNDANSFQGNASDPVATGEIVFKRDNTQRFWTTTTSWGRECHFPGTWNTSTVPASGILFKKNGTTRQAVDNNGIFYSKERFEINPATIAFNWQNTSSSSDAITIRMNYTDDMPIPEYQYKFYNQPAAYIRNTPITIKAMFSLMPAASATYVMSARAQSGNQVITQSANNVSVVFTNGLSAETSFSVGTAPGSVKKNDDMLQWGVTEDGYFLKMKKTGHRLYTLYAMPQAPWNQVVSGTTKNQNPWASALDLACGWANGATSTSIIAQNITTSINGLKNASNLSVFTYDMNSGASFYSAPSGFNLTKCITDINSGQSGFICNCWDCAHFTMTFSNLLGCSLWSGYMGGNFDLNQIVAIGQSAFGCPNWGCGFSYHAVAWTGTAGASDYIYDACLKVDGNGNPATAPRTALLPINMLFSDGNQASPYVYRESLAVPGASGYDRCNANYWSPDRDPVE